LRKGDYKLIKFWEGIYELYDLENDISEATNLAESKPELVQEMDKELVQILRDTEARIPRLNPDYQP
jgi:hypothetical protein